MAITRPSLETLAFYCMRTKPSHGASLWLPYAHALLLRPRVRRRH